LKRGHCAINSDPVSVSYAPPDDDKPENGDYWHVQLQVSCDIPGPRYFTRDGVVPFDKPRNGDWQPASMFAKRIANYPPGQWFDKPDPKEQEIFNTARKITRERGLLHD
jgi:hypothetical protein